MTDFNSILGGSAEAITSPKLSFTPTAEQQDFIDEMTNGTSNILLSAVAGSGKTATLVAACNQLSGGNVLALAFNAKIAKELGERLPSFATCKTLNAIGHGALLKEFGKVKIDARKMGKLATEACNTYDLQDYWRAIKDLLAKGKSCGLVPRSDTTPATLTPCSIEAWSELVDRFNINIDLDRPRYTGNTDTDAMLREKWEERNDKHKELIFNLCTELLKQSWQQILTEGIADFDDQIYVTAALGLPLTKYPLVLVDEAQDLSPVQHLLVERCIADSGRLIAVGDQKQAIYGFRGADSNSLAKLKEKFNMIELPLTYSFRCGKEIIKAAQAYVPDIKAPDSAPEGVVNYDADWSPTELKEGAAVLCRNTAPLVNLAYRCINEGVGVHILGRDLGIGLKKIARELSGETELELQDSIEVWRTNELLRAKAKGEFDRYDSIEDTADTLACIRYYSKAKSGRTLTNAIEALFAPDRGHVTLCTIHRSKGLEWDVVYFLASDLIPSKYALLDWMLVQEYNLAYIAITRARLELNFITVEQRR